jgi:hypothetical protein
MRTRMFAVSGRVDTYVELLCDSVNDLGLLTWFDPLLPDFGSGLSVSSCCSFYARGLAHWDDLCPCLGVLPCQRKSHLRDLVWCSCDSYSFVARLSI